MAHFVAVTKILGLKEWNRLCTYKKKVADEHIRFGGIEYIVGLLEVTDWKDWEPHFCSDVIRWFFSFFCRF